MKKVVLIGDSIRMGYQATVRERLSDMAEVWGPDENGANTVNVLVNLRRWVLGRDPDLVHVNCGLHDLKTVYCGGRENVVSLPHCRDNVAKIIRSIREKTHAQVIWATTTPVMYERAHRAHAKGHDFDRYEEDVEAYNRTAVDVASRLGAPCWEMRLPVSCGRSCSSPG